MDSNTTSVLEKLAQLVTDTEFWIALIAFAALIISSIPYMGRFFKGKVDLEIYSRIWISHAIGNPNVSLHMIIRNIGKGELKINKISANIFRDGEEVIKLPAQNYVANSKDNQNILLTKFYMKPNEEWSHLVNFFQFFKREEEKEYKKAELALRNEISRLVKLKDESEADVVVRVGDAIVQPFYDMFDKKFIWTPENYTLEIVFDTENTKENLYKKYKFTIFTNEELMQIRDNYPTGAGISFNTDVPIGIWENLEEVEQKIK